jgi:hypothetical protein
MSEPGSVFGELKCHQKSEFFYGGWHTYLYLPGISVRGETWPKQRRAQSVAMRIAGSIL